MKSRLRALITCSAGVERMVKRELESFSLGNAIIQANASGSRTGKLVVPEISVRQLYHCNVMLRTADRVFVQGPSFRAQEFWELEAAMKRVHSQLLPWLPTSGNIRVQCTSKSSRLIHEGAIEERIQQLLLKLADGGADDGSAEPSMEPINGPADDDVTAEGRQRRRRKRRSEEKEEKEASQLLKVVVDNNNFTLYLDSSGAPLHRRSWRHEGGPMPLRSTVAAAMLMQAGYYSKDAVPKHSLSSATANPSARPSEPTPNPYQRRFSALVDPFTGSGTIPIEAAQMVLGMPPHCEMTDGSLSRQFALQRWPSFEPGTWASVLGEAASRTKRARERLKLHKQQLERRQLTDTLPLILGCDRDAGAVARARRNAERAGVADVVAFEHATISEFMQWEGPDGGEHNGGAGSSDGGAGSSDGDGGGGEGEGQRGTHGLASRVDDWIRVHKLNEKRVAIERAAQGVALFEKRAKASGTEQRFEMKRKKKPELLKPGDEASEVDSQIDPRARGLLITNPPWGVRSSKNEKEARDLRRKLYSRFGQVVAERCGMWKLAVLCKSQQQAASVSKALQPKLQITSGGLKTWLMMRHPLRNQLAAADDLDDQHKGKGGDSYEEYYEEVAEAEEEMPAEGGTARL